MSTTALAHRLRFLRPALIGLLALDVIVLGAFAVRVESVTRTVTTPGTTARPSAPLVPAAPTSSPVPVAPATPISVTTTDRPVLAAPPASTPAPSRSTPTPTAAPTSDPGTAAARCPVALKEPAASGGLQTLIGYAPAFGPFRDEAFAAASAYQPLLQLLGPILARYPQLAPTIEPALAPFLSAFATLLDQGYALIAPLYAPHREEVLDAESKLAAALAPYAQQLVGSPLGSCVVDLQAALLQDTA